MTSPLRIALPKGRMLDASIALFGDAGLDLSSVKNDGRRLVHPVDLGSIGAGEVIVLRASDVAAYVEGGACAVGVAGYDTIVEQEPNVLAPLDLGFGRCRMAIAGLPDVDPRALETPRIATKYPVSATGHFLGLGRPAQIIELSGAVEIAPVIGLADAIVDIVETGETLRQNGLVEWETLFEISSRLVINRAAFHLRMSALRELQDRLGKVLREREAA